MKFLLIFLITFEILKFLNCRVSEPLYSTKIFFQEVKDDCEQTKKGFQIEINEEDPDDVNKKEAARIPPSTRDYKESDEVAKEEKSAKEEDENKEILKNSKEKKNYNLNGYYRDYMRDFRRTRLKRYINESAFKNCTLNKKDSRFRLLSDNYDDEAKIMMYQYDVNSDEFLDRKEFQFLMIELVYNYNFNLPSTNHLFYTRDQIVNMFDIIDCDSNGYIDSTDIYIFFFKKMTKYGPSKALKCYHYDAWVEKADTDRNSILDLNEFVLAVLRGEWELNYQILD